MKYSEIMADFRFRLNRHTFVRKYPEYYYLENQISHIRVLLPPEEFRWLSSVGYDSSFLFGREYGDAADRESKKELLCRLDKAWIIDIETADGFPERQFRYRDKEVMDKRFSELPPIGMEDAGGNPYLRNLQIELTDACNERCIHCYLPNDKKDKCKALAKDEVSEILRQYRDMEGLKVVFSGGEILLHPHLFSILDECKRLNLMILLQSNLLCLTETDVERLKKLDVFNIQVSLYSTDEKIHESITGRKGSFAKTKRNLELLVKNDIPVMISCPIMNANFQTVRELYRYARSLSVDIYFDFIMMAGCDGCRDNLSQRLNMEQTKDMLEFYIETNRLYSAAIAESLSMDEALSKRYARRRTMCDILSASLCIDSDGTIYPCPGWNGLALGNVKSDGLSAVWLSEGADSLRRTDMAGFEKCRNCDKHNFCDMCAVYNYNENGDMFDVCGRFCEMAELLRKCVIAKYKELHR